MLNPVKMYHEMQKNKEIEKEACSVFRQRLSFLLFPKNREEQKTITSKLKEKGITALVLKNLTDAVARDIEVGASKFRKSELRKMKVHGVRMLSEVEGGDYFANMVIVLRDAYAGDVASHISCEEAVAIIIETFLMHP